MSVSDQPIRIATRGSALALVQSRAVMAQCQAAFPDLLFELKIIKTTGDKLQTMALTNPNQQVTKGLFTKELEVAMLNGEADFAVHSLKDLPTELPPGLKLGAVSKRADVRDVFIYRDAAFWKELPGGERPKRGLAAGSGVMDLPSGAVVATSSTRRQAQLLALRPDLQVVPIRGNVGTRLQKLADQAELDALVLAGAGLGRLGFTIAPNGQLQCSEPPIHGLLATMLDLDQMLPCVGQGALGIEMRENDPRIQAICDRLNDWETHQCVLAERTFLHAMGGGCLSPVAAYAELLQGQMRMRAVSFRDGTIRRAELWEKPDRAKALGKQAAAVVSVNHPPQ